MDRAAQRADLISRYGEWYADYAARASELSRNAPSGAVSCECTENVCECEPLKMKKDMSSKTDQARKDRDRRNRTAWHTDSASAMEAEGKHSERAAFEARRPQCGIDAALRRQRPDVRATLKERADRLDTATIHVTGNAAQTRAEAIAKKQSLWRE
jgi:hypothetical protein